MDYYYAQIHINRMKKEVKFTFQLRNDFQSEVHYNYMSKLVQGVTHDNYMLS